VVDNFIVVSTNRVHFQALLPVNDHVILLVALHGLNSSTTGTYFGWYIHHRLI
jgi:hypothetical protein